MAITARNHFVPQCYLKNFADTRGFTQRYSLVVSKTTSDPWKHLHTNNVGYRNHLYTFAGGPLEDDQLERYFGRSFENDAANAIDMAIRGQKMRPDDWAVLTDFVALQIVRTPAFLARNLLGWNASVPKLLEKTMDDLRNWINAGGQKEEDKTKIEVYPFTAAERRMALTPKQNPFPIKVTQEKDEDPEMVSIKAETVVGRAFWAYTMKHLLSYPKLVLRRHRWTVLHAPPGFVWPTSDDPVLPLHSNSPSQYDFGGGWNRPGSEFLLPLSPNRLLYTRIDGDVLSRGWEMPLIQARRTKSLILQHASREIYSLQRDKDVERLRPKRVDEKLIRYELEGWKGWHREHSQAEQEIFSRPSQNDDGQDTDMGR